MYREVCWHMEELGAVGETILHMCLLNATSTHADLAKRLIRLFPKLINDIYQSEEYYGENVLHMAIVNEDPAMVKFLLDHGVDYHQRCYGNFFCPDDQKDSRTDNWDHEEVDVCLQTNCEGYTYWGEYPLAFAACVEQEECVRILCAKGANPNLQDSNGNTVMHILVIKSKLKMFLLLFSFGARLDIKNRQGLTPLSIAAKLAKKEMYDHIINLEREQYWEFGVVICQGYPLKHIDTISETGEINTNSTLSLIVYGDKEEHLFMMDGIIFNLLQEKWCTFARFRFYRRFVFFTLYFLIFAIAFGLRPGADPRLKDLTSPSNPVIQNSNNCSKNPTKAASQAPVDKCYLLYPYTNIDYIRLPLEIISVICAGIYLTCAGKEIYHQGMRIFLTTLKSAPAKAMFLMSCVLVLAMIPGRLTCSYQYEDITGVMAILCTAPYFLFFCRGFAVTGPFVVMVYSMIKGDLLRFFIIYGVFVIGFSQAMYISFRDDECVLFSSPLESIAGLFIVSLGTFADFYISLEKLSRNSDIAKENDGQLSKGGNPFHDFTITNMKTTTTDSDIINLAFYIAFHGVEDSPFSHPLDAICAMFAMAMGNIEEFYDTFENAKSPELLTFVFIMYMVLVSLLLINMLIAMMGNTYQLVASQQKEWFRQWANIVLVIEQTVTTQERIEQQQQYSQSLADGRRVLVIRCHVDEVTKIEYDTDEG